MEFFFVSSNFHRLASEFINKRGLEFATMNQCSKILPIFLRLRFFYTSSPELEKVEDVKEYL